MYVVPRRGDSGQHRVRLDHVYLRNTLSIPSDVHWGLRTTCTDGLFGASCVRVVFAVLALGNLANQASNGMFSPVWCARENQPEMFFLWWRSRPRKVFSGPIKLRTLKFDIPISLCDDYSDEREKREIE